VTPVTFQRRTSRSPIRRQRSICVDGDIENRDVCGCRGHTHGVNEGLRIQPADVEDADPIARLFIASKATMTFLPNIHTDEEISTSSPTWSCAISKCTWLRRTVRSVASSPCMETWWSSLGSPFPGARSAPEPRSRERDVQEDGAAWSTSFSPTAGATEGGFPAGPGTHPRPLAEEACSRRRGTPRRFLAPAVAK
jgi:hypothetical protein